MFCLDPSGVEYEALVRESCVDDLAGIAHGLDGVVLAVKSSKHIDGLRSPRNPGHIRAITNPEALQPASVSPCPSRHRRPDRPPEAIATSRGQDPTLYLDSPFLLLGTTQTIPDDLARLADLGVDDVPPFASTPSHSRRPSYDDQPTCPSHAR